MIFAQPESVGDPTTDPIYGGDINKKIHGGSNPSELIQMLKSL